MENYKKQITDKVKPAISDWIARQKSEHPNQLLRSNFKILFPKGFKSGQNTIPVVTPSKGGQRLVGDIAFYLQDDLVLNIDEVELNLKNQPYKEKKQVRMEVSSVDSSLDVINNIILGASDLMASLAGGSTIQQAGPAPLLSNPLKTREFTRVTPKVNGDELTKTARVMLLNPDLPDYIRTIQDRNVRERLLEKMAEAYLHYSNRLGYNADLSEFFNQWTKQLEEQGRIYSHCKWKGIPVELDTNGWCSEFNCSKQPYRDECPQITYRFGIKER